MSLSNATRGQSLLAALVVLTIMGFIALAVSKYSEMLSRRTRQVKIKASLNSIEKYIRAQVYDFNNYKAPAVAADKLKFSKRFVGPKLLQISPSPAQVFPRLIKTITGARCSQASCGIIIGNITETTNPEPSVRFEISYQGREVVIAPRSIILPLVHLNADLLCPIDKPVFRGLSSSGIAICEALPTCEAGEIMAGIDPFTFKPLCQKLAATRVGCANPNEYISSIEWKPKLKLPNRMLDFYDLPIGSNANPLEGSVFEPSIQCSPRRNEDPYVLQN